MRRCYAARADFDSRPPPLLRVQVGESESVLLVTRSGRSCRCAVAVCPGLLTLTKAEEEGAGERREEEEEEEKELSLSF